LKNREDLINYYTDELRRKTDEKMQKAHETKMATNRVRLQMMKRNMMKGAGYASEVRQQLLKNV